MRTNALAMREKHEESNQTWVTSPSVAEGEVTKFDFALVVLHTGTLPFCSTCLPPAAACAADCP
jgi:hypothetical protein